MAVFQLSCAIKCFPCKPFFGFREPFKVSFERNRPTCRKREAQIVWSHEKVANLDVYVCARPFIHPLGTAAATSSPTPFIRLSQQQIKRPAMKFISPQGAFAPHKKATRPGRLKIERNCFSFSGAICCRRPRGRSTWLYFLTSATRPGAVDTLRGWLAAWVFS